MPQRATSIAFAAAALAVAGILPACASKEAPKPTAQTPDGTVVVVNTICPIAGDDFARHEMPVKLTREWKGTRMGFCCENCPPKFDAMTAAQKDEARSLALANKAPANPE